MEGINPFLEVLNRVNDIETEIDLYSKMILSLKKESFELKKKCTHLKDDMSSAIEVTGRDFGSGNRIYTCSICKKNV